jgi:hypothetical protein
MDGSGERSDLAIYAWGLHGFTSFGRDQAEEANARADRVPKEAMEVSPQRVLSAAIAIAPS